MEIRYPKTEGYIKGSIDPNVIKTTNLKRKVALERGLDKIKYTNALSKMRSEMWFPNIDITEVEIYNIKDTFGGVPVIRYERFNQDKKDVIVFFHGGGFYGGSVNTIQNTCRYISQETGATVISVDYSLAPEYPFPTSINEGYTVINNIKDEYENIYLAGDSAGGSIATSVLIKDIEESKTRISKGLILYYPVLLIDLKDNVMEDFVWDVQEYNIDENDPNSSLMKSEATGLKYAMSFIKHQYIKTKEEASNYYISQIASPNTILREFPKTLIFTAEFDYLRLEAEYFYNRLQNCGVDVKGIRYAGETHAFIDKTGYNDNLIDSVSVIKEFLNDKRNK